MAFDSKKTAKRQKLGANKMNEYELLSDITVSATTIVEAESLEEAIEISKAREAVIGDIYSDREYWVIEEVDGEPQNIHEQLKKGVKIDNKLFEMIRTKDNFDKFFSQVDMLATGKHIIQAAEALDNAILERIEKLAIEFVYSILKEE